MNNKLVLFTASFPFGKRENFLEFEVNFLARRFDSIRIIPFGGLGELPRPVPENCIVDKRLHYTRRKRILLGLLGMWRVLPVYMKDLVSTKPFKKKMTLKIWATSMLCTSFYMQSKPVKELENQSLEDTVFYYYWGVIYNSIAPFFKGRAKMVSRFHGDWDLWSSSENEGYKPIRKATVDALTLAALISNKGVVFFKKRYPNCPTVVSHLGSIDKGVCEKSEDGVLRVVSCSTVYPLKRVPLIYESLKEVAKNRTVEWTHIGGGKDFEKLKTLVNSEYVVGLNVTLTGEVSLSDVLNYYKTHRIDLFINLSTNEGVPVSIMEAISFDIPIVATDVGGNSEIVNAETGLLVSANPTKEEVAEAIEKVMEDNCFAPRMFWNKEFNAAENYSAFAEILYNL